MHRPADPKAVQSNKRARTSNMGNYEVFEKVAVGEGAYGIVYKARNTVTRETVAIKRMRMDDENEGISATALREIVILRELQHENLLRLHEVFYVNSRYNLVLEWVDHDLRKHMDDLKATNCQLSRESIRKIMYQILQGIDYCHSHNIFHRDLKPHNILITTRGTVKIADFGLARVFSIPIRHYTHEVVTLWYRAPEILLGQRRYSIPIDMWSVGCIFAELCDMKALWPGDSEIDQLFRIFRCLGTPYEGNWPGVTQLPECRPIFPKWPAMPFEKVVTNQDKLTVNGRDLLSKMFVYHPGDRVTARAALAHEYFADLRRNENVKPSLKQN